MKFRLLLIFLLFNFLNILSQNSFLPAWQGSYEGELNIYAIDSIGMKLSMKLAIIPTDNPEIFSWKTTYTFQGENDVRDYLIKPIEVSKGHYRIDEQNNILLDSYYRNETLTSIFEVNGSLIVTSHKKVDDDIIFEIFAANTQAKTETGGGTHEGEEIPVVYNYPVNGRQYALLKKIN